MVPGNTVEVDTSSFARTCRWRWVFISIYVGLIFLTLPLTPRIVQWSSRFVKTDELVNFVMVTTGCALLVISLFRALRNSFITALKLIAAFIPLSVLAFWVIQRIRLPIERLHVMEYAVLSVLLYRAFRTRRRVGYSLVIAFLITSLVGASDEGIQYLLPNRVFGIHDALFNVAGGAAGLLYYGIFRQICRKKDVGPGV